MPAPPAPAPSMIDSSLPDPFVAHRPLRRMLPLLAIAPGFVALGLWLAGVIGHTDFDADPGRRLGGLAALTGMAPSTVAAAIGWVCVLLFGAFGVMGARYLFDRGPVMRIDAAGVWWKLWSDETIPWDQVRNPRVLSVQRQRFVGFDLADRARNRPTTLAGRLAGANRAFGYGDVSLSVTAADRGFDEMAAAFFAFYAAAGAPAPEGGDRPA